MKKHSFSDQDLEQQYVKDGILLERKDLVTKSFFYVPNLNKIRIMLREFEFLVDGASRGRAINEISNIEIYLHKNEDKPELQKIHLAENYSNSSIYLESKSDIISDMNSENWDHILIQYFSFNEIHNYFNKTEGASPFFRRFNIFKEMIELNFHIKLMVYLQDQIEIYNPSREDRVIPYTIHSLEMIILVLKRLGFIDNLKKVMKSEYYVNGAKLLTTMLGKPSSNWCQINAILWDLDNNEKTSINEDPALEAKLKDVLFHYKIDLRSNNN